MDGEEQPTHYFFRISLRVRHPWIAPEKITEAIGIEPKRSWKVGGPPPTPKGKFLTGNYPDTFLCAANSSRRLALENHEAGHNGPAKVGRFRAFFPQNRGNKGAGEMFIGWFFENQ